MDPATHPADPWARSSSPGFKGSVGNPGGPHVVKAADTLETHFHNTRRERFIRSGVDTLLNAAECLPPFSDDLLRQTARDIIALPSPQPARISISSLLTDTDLEPVHLKRPAPPEFDRPAKVRRLPDPLLAPVATLYPVAAAAAPAPPTGPSGLITVSCFHALVAQKSYGSEKRFLCPPPLVTVRGYAHQPLVTDALPFSPELAVAVVNDQGHDTQVRSAVTLDAVGAGVCRHLHVSNMAKSKSFRLRLELPYRPEYAAATASSLPYATFESAPITIISKPSKKTAKARNTSSCILSGSSIALFNRINSQTVRTKFLMVHQDALCARNGTWTAFTISLVAPGGPARPDRHALGTPITYGSHIVLHDPTTGVQTETMIIRKVEKGRLAVGALGPVSQMQKIAFQRLTPPRTAPLYLSSVTDSELDAQPADHGASATPLPTPPLPAPGNSSPPLAAAAATAPLLFLPSATAPPPTPPFVTAPPAEIDDKLCWTVVGITRFDYSFMETEGPARSPITPFPDLAAAPVYRSANHTLELRIITPPLDLRALLHTRQPPILRLRLGTLGLFDSHITLVTPPPAREFIITHELTTQRAPLESSEDPTPAFAMVLTASLPSVADVFRPSDRYHRRPSDPPVRRLPIQMCRLDGVVYDTGFDLVFDNQASFNTDPEWSTGRPGAAFAQLQIRIIKAPR